MYYLIAIEGIEERIKVFGEKGVDSHLFLHDVQVEKNHFWKLIW